MIYPIQPKFVEFTSQAERHDNAHQTNGFAHRFTALVTSVSQLCQPNSKELNLERAFQKGQAQSEVMNSVPTRGGLKRVFEKRQAKSEPRIYPDLKQPTRLGLCFRGDSRDIDKLMGGVNSKGLDMDLRKHIVTNHKDSGYISTSDELPVALDFALKTGKGTVLLIKKSTSEHKAVRINDNFGTKHVFSYEKEIAFKRQIPSKDIIGAFRATRHSENMFSIAPIKFNKR